MLENRLCLRQREGRLSIRIRTSNPSISKQGIEFITSVRSNMKPKLLTLVDKILLQMRFIIETIIDPLKNISQIERGRLDILIIDRFGIF